MLSALLEASPSPSIAVWMPARAAAAAAAAADDSSARGRTDGSTKCQSSVGAFCEEGGGGLGGGEGEAAPPRLNSIQVPDAKSALACYAAGNSLYFSAPDPFVLRYVRAAAADAGMSFAAAAADGGPRGQVEVFAARAGHVTDWHQDFMDNFTVQLRGTKVWRLRRNACNGGAAYPLRGCTPHYSSGEGTWEQQLLVHRLC